MQFILPYHSAKKIISCAHTSYLVGEENINGQEEQTDTKNCPARCLTESLQESWVGLHRDSLVLVRVVT